jgi:hypothetical protein
VSAVSLFEMFEKGLPPVTGGVLDQSAWFVEAARFFEHQESQLKAESYRE